MKIKNLTKLYKDFHDSIFLNKDKKNFPQKFKLKPFRENSIPDKKSSTCFPVPTLFFSFENFSNQEIMKNKNVVLTMYKKFI